MKRHQTFSKKLILQNRWIANKYFACAPLNPPCLNHLNKLIFDGL